MTSSLSSPCKDFSSATASRPKGLIGKQSIIAMDVTPEDRIKQIMLNMERWRWMPDTLGQDHFLVNLAAFELQRVQSSVIVERMNVVVGAVATQTPEFSDEMEYVELNPTWTVPYSIATKEMLPKLRANPLCLCGRLRCLCKRRAVLLGLHQLGRLWPRKIPLHLPAEARTEERAGQGEVHAAQQAQHLSA